MPSLRLLVASLLLSSVVWAGTARAEAAPPEMVGRIAAVAGGVSLRPASGGWGDSALNDPVASGMALRTSSTGRATLGIGPRMVALSGGSELDIVRLDEGILQIAVRQGRIGLHVARLDPGETVEIDLSRGGLWLLAPGDYDITAGNEQSAARVAVFDGRVRFVGEGADATVMAGSAVTLSGKGLVSTSIESAKADDFVATWRPTPGDPVEPVALRHVSPDMTGWETLDANGSWETVADLGAVWCPTTLPEDWAPYRNGHWRWVMPWGWNWIDDMRWGFAPSHYGRWARVNERWGWVPGDRAAPPVYAPALVDFLGTAGVGLSYPDASGPAVAWFPLAPGEVYWPSYTSALEAIRRLNAGAVKDVSKIGAGIDGEPPGDLITAPYQNRRFASVVPRSVFVGGRAVAPALVQLPEPRLDNAPLLPGSPQIGPPAPRPVVLAGRPVLAHAVNTLARILSPRQTMTAARTVVLRPSRQGWWQPRAQARAVFTARVARSAQRARAYTAAAYARTSRVRTHLAAAGRGRLH
jgi:hypothetical protein